MSGSTPTRHTPGRHGLLRLAEPRTCGEGPARVRWAVYRLHANGAAHAGVEALPAGRWPAGSDPEDEEAEGPDLILMMGARIPDSAHDGAAHVATMQEVLERSLDATIEAYEERGERPEAWRRAAADTTRAFYDCLPWAGPDETMMAARLEPPGSRTAEDAATEEPGSGHLRGAVGITLAAAAILLLIWSTEAWIRSEGGAAAERIGGAAPPQATAGAAR